MMKRLLSGWRRHRLPLAAAGLGLLVTLFLSPAAWPGLLITAALLLTAAGFSTADGALQQPAPAHAAPAGGVQESGDSPLLEKLARGDLTGSYAEFQAAPASHQHAAVYYQRVLGRIQDTTASISEASGALVEQGQALASEAEVLTGSLQTTRAATAATHGAIGKLNQFTSRLGEVMASVHTQTRGLASDAAGIDGAARLQADSIAEINALVEAMNSAQREVREALAALRAAGAQGGARAEAAASELEALSGAAAAGLRFAQSVADGSAAAVLTAERSAAAASRIEENHDEVIRRIEELAERSQQIGTIIAAIDGIADQTNLLALNAAILAAQATSVEGQGFRVVADEMRSLSLRSAQSVKEVGAILGAIREGVQSASRNIVSSKAAVNEGIATAAELMERLGGLGKEAGSAAEGSERIAAATKAQARIQADLSGDFRALAVQLKRFAELGEAQSGSTAGITAAVRSVAERAAENQVSAQRQKEGTVLLASDAEEAQSAAQAVTGDVTHIAQQAEQLNRTLAAIERSSQQTSLSLQVLSGLTLDLRQVAILNGGEFSSVQLPVPRRGGTLRSAYVPNDKVKFDKEMSFNVRDSQMIAFFYDCLVGFGDGGQLIPKLAERWEISHDGLTYTFHLRAGVRFHSGREMTASDVRASWLRAIDPARNSYGAWIFDLVAGVPDYPAEMAPAEKSRSFRQAMDKIAIRAPEPRRLMVTLKEPVAFFIKTLALDSTAVVPAETLFTAIDQPDGTGPFILEEYRPDEKLILRRNPDYFVPGHPFVDRIEYDILRDLDQVYAGFLAGRYDFIDSFPPGKIGELLHDPDRRPYIESNYQLTTAYIGMHVVGSPGDPLSDKRVRQALALAINREQVAASTSAAQASSVAQGLLPPGMLGYDPDLKGWPHDPERARRLLSDAGFGGGLNLDLMHGRGPSGAENKIIIEQLAAVGVTLTDIQRDYHDHYLMVAKGEEPDRSVLFRAGWVADFPDPDNFLYILFHSRDLAQMKFNFSSADFDRLTEKARRSANVLEREKLYRDAEKILLDECPALFLYHNRAFAARQPWLKGMKLYLTPPPLRESELYLDQ